MRITFIHPAGYNFKIGGPDVTRLVNRMAPIGILQLAAVLDQDGHTTFVHDCLGPWAARGAASNIDTILETRPDLLAFTATTSSFLDGYDMAVILKQKRPGVKVIFGGAHVSAIGGELLSFFPAIDYLCIGEGEGCIRDLAAGLSPDSIPNLAFRQGETTVANPRRKRLTALDTLPFPAYEKLSGFPKHYHLPLFSFVKRFGATLVSSRGCPHACSFCDRTVFEQEYASNSPEYVWEHMRYLRDRYSVYHINFYDDHFTANRMRILALCELLLRKPLGVDFNCALRVGQDDPTILTYLKRAGCLQVSLGVESGDPALLARHKSGITLEAVRRTTERAHSVGLRVKGLFIFGLPGETPATVQATADFIDEMEFDEVNISKFSPFYGAPVWWESNSGTHGVVHEDWRLMNCLHFTFLPNGFRSFDEMDFLYNTCLTRFYRGKHYQRLFRCRMWQHRWSLWHVLTHLPAFIKAHQHFKPKLAESQEARPWQSTHPEQVPISVLVDRATRGHDAPLRLDTKVVRRNKGRACMPDHDL